MSQYIHNRYQINPAFGGNREVLSAFLAYRQKWLGIEGSPNMQYISIHTPLKKSSIALGGELYNEQYAIFSNRGFSASYTQRFKLQNNFLSFGLKAGLMYTTSEWSKISTLDVNTDPVFQATDSYINPAMGLGIAFYGEKFFSGVSIPSFFKYNIFENGSPELDFNAINYIATAGYLFTLGESLAIQPSFAANYNPQTDPIIDGSLSTIISDMIWITAAYRNTEELVAILGFQVNNQLRVGYSYDYSTNDIATYNSGTHEISIQYDFGYKIRTASPKFF